MFLSRWYSDLTGGPCIVESAAVFLNLIVVAAGPVDQYGDGIEQGGTEIGERILDPWRDLGVGGSGDETVALQLAKGVGQHAL